jgi:hypothetical protein
LALVAFWDEENALDRFVRDDALAAALAGGWHVRLEPVRVHGAWDGLPDDLATTRASVHDGRAVVLTLGRLRLTQTIRFLRTSARAERRVISSPGLLWATGLGRPPFVATCSLWQETASLAAYAYGSAQPEHANAIAAGTAKPFHHQQAFVRFRPYRTEGCLAGSNPLAESWMSRSLHE